MSRPPDPTPTSAPISTSNPILTPTPPAVRNAHRIRDEIASLAPNATLVIVTKTQPMDTVRILFEAGFRDFGENRADPFIRRQGDLPDARWHFIGHLSRKNVARVVGRAELIHSVDSEPLLEKIRRSCEAAEVIGQRVLLQVNTSGEEAKQGFTPDGLRSFAAEFHPSAYPRVSVEGLMTMAPYTRDESVLRDTFSSLRRLRDEVNQHLTRLGYPCWTHLSMGMSNDYRVALREGATMVRLGTVLFS